MRQLRPLLLLGSLVPLLAACDDTTGPPPQLSLVVCGTSLDLSAGEYTTSGPSEAGECDIFLPSGEDGDRYRIGLVWASSTAATDAASVTLQVGGEGVATAPRPAPTAPADAEGTAIELPTETIRRDLERKLATEAVHHRLWREAAELSARLGPPALFRDREEGAAGATTAAQQVRTFNEAATSCSGDLDEIDAELILETDDVVFYQDTLQRDTLPVDSTLVRQMADFYADYGRQVIEDYFGGISDVDGNDGKFLVLIADIPEDIGEDAAAFVLSRDFFSPDQCAGSNHAEITYFNAGVIRAMSGENPSFQALGTLVHEVKHISSLYNRVQAGDLGDRPSWIEEGTADIAAEVASRLGWADGGGPAAGGRVSRNSFGQTGTTPENWGILLRLARTVLSLSSQPNALTEDPDDAEEGHTYVGSSWHFHRLLGDAYAGGIPDEAAFFRDQNAMAADPGVEHLESATGAELETLLEELAVATMVNGVGVEQDVEVGFSGYGFPSAAEIFCAPNPLGVYPWPVTTSGNRQQGGCDNGYDPGQEQQDPSASFASDSFEGTIGRGGLRIHDFESDGTGSGAEITVQVSSPAADALRLVVVRLN